MQKLTHFPLAIAILFVIFYGPISEQQTDALVETERDCAKVVLSATERVFPISLNALHKVEHSLKILIVDMMFNGLSYSDTVCIYGLVRLSRLDSGVWTTAAKQNRLSNYDYECTVKHNASPRWRIVNCYAICG